MKYVFLSQDFFKDHPLSAFPEIEAKQNRPYILLVVIEYEEQRWGLPLRSNIKQQNPLRG